jgi:hypothetical protein
VGAVSQPTDSRADWLTGVTLVSHRGMLGEEAAEKFTSPGSAIVTLTHELERIWDAHRSADPNERRIGTLQLGSGAYLQWIGYSDRIAVECSSNDYLPAAHQLSVAEEERLVHWDFNRPTHDVPNFWMDVVRRDEVKDAAFAVVAVMTTVFGVFAG